MTPLCAGTACREHMHAYMEEWKMVACVQKLVAWEVWNTNMQWFSQSANLVG